MSSICYWKALSIIILPLTFILYFYFQGFHDNHNLIFPAVVQGCLDADTFLSLFSYIQHINCPSRHTTQKHASSLKDTTKTANQLYGKELIIMLFPGDSTDPWGGPALLTLSAFPSTLYPCTHPHSSVIAMDA